MNTLACTILQKSLTKNFIIQSMEGKKIGQIQGRLRGNGWFAIPRHNASLSTCIQNMNTLACTGSQKSLTKNFIIQSMERKKIGEIKGRIRGEGWFAIPRYNTSLSTCSPNMTTLACTVSQKSLTKNFIIQSMEWKKIGQIQGRIRRWRLVCNPTIQHVIINLYTKYDSSSLQSCGEIFDEKVLRNYRRTDAMTDGMTDRCKPGYPPLFQSGGINHGG